MSLYVLGTQFICRAFLNLRKVFKGTIYFPKRRRFPATPAVPLVGPIHELDLRAGGWRYEFLLEKDVELLQHSGFLFV
jgi:hypothetical protein